MICPNCGNANETQVRFCGKCGTQMPATQSSPAQEQPVSAAPGLVVQVDPTSEAMNAPVVAAKPKRKKWPFVLGGIGVAAVLLLVVGLLFGERLFAMVAPNAYVKTSLFFTRRATAASLDDLQKGMRLNAGDASDGQTFDFSAFIKTIEDAGDVTDVNMGLRGILALGDGEINQQYTLYDPDGDIASLQSGWNQSRLAVAMPEVLGDLHLGVPTKGFGAAWRASAFADYIAFAENLDLTPAKGETTSALSKETRKAMDACLTDFLINNMQDMGTAQITIDGRQVTVQKYRLVIKQARLQKLAEDLIDLLLEDDDFWAAMDRQAILDPDEDANFAGIGIESSQLSRDDLLELRDALDIQLRDDIPVDLYFHSFHLVLAELKNFDIGGATLNVALDMTGSNDYLEDIALTVRVSSGGENITLKVNSTGTHGGRNWTDKTTIKLTAAGQTLFSFDSDFEMNTSKEKSYVLNAKGSIPGVLKMTAKLDATKKTNNLLFEVTSDEDAGESFLVRLEGDVDTAGRKWDLQLEVSVEDSYSNESSGVTMDLSFSVKPGCNWRMPEGDYRNVLDMTEEELGEIFTSDEVAQRLEDLMARLEEALPDMFGSAPTSTSLFAMAPQT